MAQTVTAPELVVKKWLAKFFREYVRNNRFAKETGTDVNNVICIKEGRKQIEIPLVTRLKGNGVSGSSTLRGNGESIGNYGFTVTPTYYRHAVEFDKEEMEKPNIDLMNAARPLLMDWSMELTRDQIIEALGAIHNGTTYSNYGSTAAAAFDTWLTNNSDRIYYGDGAAVVAGDHTASLVAMNNTNDKFNYSALAAMKRLAKNARPRIRPIKVNGDEEYFIAYADSYAFRDFKASLETIHQNASTRGRSNPLFRDNDLEYDGVIIREVPEIADFIDGDEDGYAPWGANATADGLHAAGAGSIRTTMVNLCGAQAAGFGLGQRPNVIVDRDYDYGFQPGVAVECKHDIRKAYYDSGSGGSTHKQHGVVSGFFAAVI